MNFLLLCLDRYLFSVISDNKYLPKGSKENVISTTITGNITIQITVQICRASSNYTTFGLCHDSLNLLNSVTII